VPSPKVSVAQPRCAITISSITFACVAGATKIRAAAAAIIAFTTRTAFRMTLPRLANVARNVVTEDGIEALSAECVRAVTASSAPRRRLPK
jgi:hypothetical protein